MATVHRFEDLEIWKLARQLSVDIFELTQTLPLSKDFSLKDQMNRSSGSIMDNIAEGFGRSSGLEFIQFFSLDKKYISEEKFNDFYEKTNALYKKINGFIKYLNSSIVKGVKFKDRVSTKTNDK